MGTANIASTKLAKSWAHLERCTRKLPANQKLLEKEFLAILRTSEVIETFWNGKSLRAIFVIQPYVGDKIRGMKSYPTAGFASGFTSDAEVKRWFRVTLAKHQKHFDKRFNIFLPLEHPFLIKEFEKYGLEKDHYRIAARVDESLKKLDRVRDMPEDLGFRFEEVKSVPRFRKSLRILFACIRENPDYYWAQRWMRMHPPRRIQLFRSGEATYFAITRIGQKKVLGHFGYTLYKNSAFFGDYALFEIAFLSEIRGIGLARIAYRHMLESLKKKKIKTYLGHSRNPIVLRIGKEIGRVPCALSLNRR